jgi:hypothetical protein
MPAFTLQYVYALGDFDTSAGLDSVPNEQGARAQGSPPWNLQLNAGASPQQLTANDGDGVFNEISSADQTLIDPITIDGVTYPVGSRVLLNYVITTDSGFQGFSITIGSNNSGNNTTTAFITTEPLVPGQLYTFTSEGNIGNSTAYPHTEFACFVAGSMVATPEGDTAIEDLNVGDLVETMDDGPQRIRWIGKRTLPGTGKMAPVVFQTGTLGATSDLAVSPNHRMLIEGAPAELFLGQSAAFVAAKALVNGTTVERMPQASVSYVHIMFDAHQIIWANGVPSESFFASANALASLEGDQARELEALFPGAFKSSESSPYAMARPETRLFEGRLLGDLI